MEDAVREKGPVQVKGIGNSLTVLVDPRQPLPELKQELQRVFEPFRQAAANARIVLDTGDEQGHDELLHELGAFLQENYRITATDRLTERSRDLLQRKERPRGPFHRGSEVLMMRGLVRSGQKIDARNHFLLLGDLNPGSEVIAGGDILILGSLRGKAIAGYPDNESALILALDFRPTQIQIGGHVAAGLPSSRARTAEFAHVQNGAIVVDDYLKSAPFGGLPLPEIC